MTGNSLLAVIEPMTNPLSNWRLWRWKTADPLSCSTCRPPQTFTRAYAGHRMAPRCVTEIGQTASGDKRSRPAHRRESDAYPNKKFTALDGRPTVNPSFSPAAEQYAMWC